MSFSPLIKVKKYLNQQMRVLISKNQMPNFHLKIEFFKKVFLLVFYLHTDRTNRDLTDCYCNDNFLPFFLLSIKKEMARRPSAVVNVSAVAATANRWQNLRSINESSPTDEQRNQMYSDRRRLLSPKVERCVQELVERVYKRNSSLNFELLAPPSSHLSPYLSSENKEFYFDFYLVWKTPGRIEIERDSSSVCCKIKSLDRSSRWSRAEQDRLLLVNMNRKRISYLNGRGLRDVYFETLHEVSPDLIRLDFIEHLIYFDLIIPTPGEKSICHVTLLPCIHLAQEHEVLLPFGTLRWYPRSLLPHAENRPAFLSNNHYTICLFVVISLRRTSLMNH